MFKSKMKTSAKHPPAPNLGALFDVPTGRYMRGEDGAMILSGGRGFVETVAGGGNIGKSLLTFHKELMLALNNPEYQVAVLDTEVSVVIERYQSIMERIPGMEGRDIEDIFVVTDQSEQLMDDWFEDVKAIFKEKQKDKKDFFTTPMLDDSGHSNIKVRKPFGMIIDSLSEGKTNAEMTKFVDKEKAGDSALNTLYLKGAMAKKHIITQLPIIAKKNNIYVGLTVHLGNDLDMGGMFAAKAERLTHSKRGNKYTGATKAIEFINNVLQEIQRHKILKNTDYKQGLEYPQFGVADDTHKGSKDLNLIDVCMVRSKMGASGISVPVIWSQREGVRPHLTQFFYLKDKDYLNGWGVNTNSPQAMYVDLCPDVKFSRKTVREKIDTDHKLRRALEITAISAQTERLWPALPNRVQCDMQTLYDDLTAMGYDWNILLGETTGMWKYKEHQGPNYKYLSALDLLNMRAGLYKPKWYKGDIDVSKSSYK